MIGRSSLECVAVRALIVVLAFALSGCDSGKRAEAPEPDEAQQRTDRMAHAKYPALPLPAARERLAQDQAALSRDATPEARKRALAAAGHFFDFLHGNTRSRVAFCRNAGVDLASFAAATGKANAAELSQATAIYRDAGTDVEAEWRSHREALDAAVAEHMQELAQQRNTDAAGACRSFARNPEAIAKLMAFAGESVDDSVVLLAYRPTAQ